MGRCTPATTRTIIMEWTVFFWRSCGGSIAGAATAWWTACLATLCGACRFTTRPATPRVRSGMTATYSSRRTPAETYSWIISRRSSQMTSVATSSSGTAKMFRFAGAARTARSGRSGSTGRAATRTRYTTRRPTTATGSVRCRGLTRSASWSSGDAVELRR